MEKYMVQETLHNTDYLKRNIEKYAAKPNANIKQQAKESLIRSGVLNKDGSQKKTIITR